jgi:hypothetical protein
MAVLPYTGEPSIGDQRAAFQAIGQSSQTPVRCPLTCVEYLPPVDPRHWGDQLMLTLFAKETSYDTPPGSWLAATACAMLDFDDQAAHEEWDDEVDDDVATLHGEEYPTVQVIVRQSVRWTYHEPRCKPNTLAGLLGLALGEVTTSQDGALDAYRHRLRPLSSVSLPSISAQTRHAGGLQYRYTGLKSDGFTLEANGAYLGFRCPIIGSGSRETADDLFSAAIDEAWLRWGDARVYLYDTLSSVLPLPTNPVQGATNLDDIPGPPAVDLSSRIRTWTLEHGNQLAEQAGYRPSTGVVRGDFHPKRRGTSLTLEIDCRSDTEELLLTGYLTQTRFAVELNLDSGVTIAAGGAYRYGVIVILPRIRFRKVTRRERDQFDTLSLEGRVYSDRTNPVLQAWVFNAQPAYLA